MGDFSTTEFVDLVLAGNLTGLETNPRYNDFSEFFIGQLTSRDFGGTYKISAVRVRRLPGMGISFEYILTGEKIPEIRGKQFDFSVLLQYGASQPRALLTVPSSTKGSSR